MTEFTRDAGQRPILTVQSVPLGFDWLQGSTSLASNAAATFNVTITPADSRLSLWNYLISVRVDVDDDDHLFPSGDALTSEQRALRLYNWIDFAESSDLSNMRKYKIRLENSGAETHTYYLLFKAYSFAAVTGASS